MNDGFERRGVSLALMEAVCTFALGINDERGYWTIERLGALIVGNHEILKAGNRWGVDDEAARLATLTYGERCSLIDVLERHHREIPHPILGLTYNQSVSKGKADVFMSFAYAADYPELVDAARCWLEGEGEGEGAAQTVFFWFDLFVNNQWVALEKDFVWWSTTFRRAIRDIGRTLLILLPWSAPIPLTRAWCLYEIHCSTNLSIALSRQQQQAFRRQLIVNVDDITMALSKIDLSKADCYLSEDKVKIFKAVGDGIHEFNTKILAMLRRWLADTARSVVLEQEDANAAEPTISHLAAIGQVADLLHTLGDLESAADLFVRALRGQEQCPSLGPLHADTLTTIHNLAGLRSDQGRLDDADALYERALSGREELFGCNHKLTLETLNNLANLRWAQNRLEEARELFVRALAGQENHPELGPHHPESLNTVQGLALCRQDQGMLAEADSLYERALAGYDSHPQLGPSHPKTLGLLNNIACLRREQCRLSEAEDVYRRVLSLCLEQHGARHPHTLTAMHNLGVLLAECGQVDDAMDLFEQAHHGRREVLGEESLITLQTAFSWSELLESQGDLDAAEELYESCLVGREAQLGSSHPDTLSVVNNLGLLFMERGDLERGAEMLERALSGYEARDSAAGGATHQHKLTCLGNLAALRVEQGRRDSAEVLYDRALKGWVQSCGQECLHVDALDVVLSLANLKCDMAKMGEAAALYRRCLGGREILLGPLHLDTLDAAFGLANCLSESESESEEQEEEEVAERAGESESEMLLARVLAGREEQLGGDHEDTLQAVLALALHLVDRGKLEPALALAERAAEGFLLLESETRAHRLRRKMADALVNLLKLHPSLRQLQQQRLDIVGGQQPRDQGAEREPGERGDDENDSDGDGDGEEDEEEEDEEGEEWETDDDGPVDC